MNQKLMQIETQGGGGATFLYIFTLNGACGWVSNHIVFYHYADWSRENGELLWLVKSSNNVSLPFSVTISLYSEEYCSIIMLISEQMSLKFRLYSLKISPFPGFEIFPGCVPKYW